MQSGHTWKFNESGDDGDGDRRNNLGAYASGLCWGKVEQHGLAWTIDKATAHRCRRFQCCAQTDREWALHLGVSLAYRAMGLDLRPETGRRGHSINNWRPGGLAGVAGCLGRLLERNVEKAQGC